MLFNAVNGNGHRRSQFCALQGSLAIIRCISHGCLFEDAIERPKQWRTSARAALSLGYVLIASGAHLKQRGLGRARSFP